MTRNLMKAAVIAALVAPMAAQAGVYGIQDGVLKYNDDGDNDSWTVDVDKMRWGIIGSEDLGNGLKVNYRYEWAHDNGETGGSTQGGDYEKSRLAYVGLEGDWGAMTIGRNWWPSYGAVWNATDTFDAHATGGSQSNFSGNRTGDQIAYTSPNMSGFQAFAAVVVSNQNTQEDGIDVWEIGGSYKNGPLMLGGTFRNDQRGNGPTAAVAATAGTCLANGTTLCTVTVAASSAAKPADNTDVDVWGIRAKYSFGDFWVDANYGNSDAGSGGAEVDGFGIEFGATFDTNQLTIAYRNNESDSAGTSKDVDVDDWAINLRHFMSKTTRVFVEYRNTETDYGAGSTKTDTDVDMFAVGLRHDWKL